MWKNVPREGDRPRSRISRRYVVYGALLVLATAAVLRLLVFGERTPPGRSFYVSPNGQRGATGAASDPWDLATALAHPASVAPGDTIWLHGGTYMGSYTSQLKGEPDRPIIVRQLPGERATIDSKDQSSSGTLTVNGSDTWYWGFEVTNSSPRRTSKMKGSEPTDLNRPEGVVVFGPRTRFINLVVHDNADGYGFWMPAQDSEIYGNLIYYNGWAAPDRGHGHGIYAQNREGIKHIEDNIQFSGFGMGLRAYGTENASAKRIEFIGNVAINSGALFGDPPNNWANFFVSVGLGSEGILFDSNHSYHTTTADRGSSSLGWVFSSVEKDVIARRNYWIGGAPAIELWNWERLVYEDNVAYSQSHLMLVLNYKPEQDVSRYRLNRNTYYGSGLMRLNGSNCRWPQWLETSRLDADSRYNEGRPRGSWVFLRPNRYEPGRAHLILYNWDLKDSVAVDLHSVLPRGARFELRDAENFFGPPILTGIYNGEPVSVPMRGLTAATPVGLPAPQHTAPEFAVLVVLKTSAE